MKKLEDTAEFRKSNKENKILRLAVALKNNLLRRKSKSIIKKKETLNT